MVANLFICMTNSYKASQIRWICMIDVIFILQIYKYFIITCVFLQTNPSGAIAPKGLNFFSLHFSIYLSVFFIGADFFCGKHGVVFYAEFFHLIEEVC